MADEEKPKEPLSKRFERERKEWREKIKKLAGDMKEMKSLSEVLTDALSERQIALDYTHTLMSLLSTANAKLKKAKKKKFLYYTQDYDLVLQKEQKNLFIDVDLENEVVIQELISAHLSYMRGTVDSLDKLLFGIKWRMQIQDYL